MALVFLIDEFFQFGRLGSTAGEIGSQTVEQAVDQQIARAVLGVEFVRTAEQLDGLGQLALVQLDFSQASDRLGIVGRLTEFFGDLAFEQVELIESLDRVGAWEMISP